MTPTIEQIAKLPKWAQDHLNDIQRQRDSAVNRLDTLADNQTPSPFYIEEMDCTNATGGPTARRFYLQTSRIVCVHAGVRLDIYLPREKDSQRLNGIDLTYSDVRTRSGYVALIPRCSGNVQLLSKENIPS